MKKLTIFGITSIVLSILLAISLLWIGKSCDLIKPTNYCLSLFHTIVGLFILGVIFLIISFIKNK